MLTPFSPPPGLNSDDTTFAAEGQWADGNNVRFHNGKAQAIGGWVSLFDLDSAAYGTVRNIFPFARSGSVMIAYGASGTFPEPKLLVGAGLVAPSDRSPAGTPSTAIHWALDAWGDTLLAVPSGGTLYEQSGLGTATAVAAAPDNITNMLVTNERQVLALGCNEEASGTFNPMCIRGCDFEDYTDWTTDPSNNAFEHILPGSGQIVAGRRVGQFVAVWTEDALYLGQYIGNPEQTYRFDRVADGCGLVGPQAVTIYNGAAFWMAPDLRPRNWVVGGLPEILPCPISKEFRDNVALSLASRIIASPVTRYGEIWFHYADSRDGGSQNGRYIAVSLQDGSWFRGQAGRSAMIDTGLILSLTSGYPGAPTILASISGAIYLHETGSSATGSSPMNAYVQSADQYLDNSQRRMMVRGVRPDLEDQNTSVALTLYLRSYPQGDVVTKGPYTLAAGTDKKDFRASGKIVSVKFSQETGSGYFRLGKPVFDVVPLGER